VDVIRLQKLENWFNFWHFCVGLWGGFMIHITFTRSKHVFHDSIYDWVVSCFLIRDYMIM